MITLFAIPKPFKGHIGIIQYNAIKSWTLLQPSCEIMLFGDEEGTAKVANEFGLKHIENISRNANGTPLLDNLFEQAQALSSYDQLCFINSDIILTSDFMLALNRLNSTKKQFLMVGQRWDVDINEQINFELGWDNRIKSYTRENGQLHPQTGIDYFVFKKDMLGNIPPFAIGRPGYDNWLLYRARSLNIPVIDCTRVVMAIHQNHDYNHLKNIQNRLGDGPEAKYNLSLTGGYKHIYTLKNADWILTSHFLMPSINNKINECANRIKNSLVILYYYIKLI